MKVSWWSFPIVIPQVHPLQFQSDSTSRANCHSSVSTADQSCWTFPCPTEDSMKHLGERGCFLCKSSLLSSFFNSQERREVRLFPFLRLYRGLRFIWERKFSAGRGKSLPPGEVILRAHRLQTCFKIHYRASCWLNSWPAAIGEAS